jgi:hypothetical protein
MSELTSPARPPTIAALETVSLILVAGQILLGGIELGFQIVIDLLWWSFILWLVFKVTRRGSGNARIALTAIFLLGIFSVVAAMIYFRISLYDVSATLSEMQQNVPELLGFGLVLGLAIAQMALLWASPTSRWIAQHQATKRIS